MHSHGQAYMGHTAMSQQQRHHQQQQQPLQVSTTGPHPAQIALGVTPRRHKRERERSSSPTNSGKLAPSAWTPHGLPHTAAGFTYGVSGTSPTALATGSSLGRFVSTSSPKPRHAALPATGGNTALPAPPTTTTPSAASASSLSPQALKRARYGAAPHHYASAGGAVQSTHAQPWMLPGAGQLPSAGQAAAMMYHPQGHHQPIHHHLPTHRGPGAMYAAPSAQPHQHLGAPQTAQHIQHHHMGHHLAAAAAASTAATSTASTPTAGAGLGGNPYSAAMTLAQHAHGLGYPNPYFWMQQQQQQQQAAHAAYMGQQQHLLHAYPGMMHLPLGGASPSGLPPGADGNPMLSPHAAASLHQHRKAAAAALAPPASAHGRGGAPPAAPQRSRRRASSRRARVSFSQEAVTILQRCFEIEPYPSRSRMLRLAAQFSESLHRIRNWYSNARADRPDTRRPRGHVRCAAPESAYQGLITVSEEECRRLMTALGDKEDFHGAKALLAGQGTAPGTAATAATAATGSNKISPSNAASTSTSTAQHGGGGGSYKVSPSNQSVASASATSPSNQAALPSRNASGDSVATNGKAADGLGKLGKPTPAQPSAGTSSSSGSTTAASTTSSTTTAAATATTFKLKTLSPMHTSHDGHSTIAPPAAATTPSSSKVTPTNGSAFVATGAGGVPVPHVWGSAPTSPGAGYGNVLAGARAAYALGEASHVYAVPAKGSPTAPVAATGASQHAH